MIKDTSLVNGEGDLLNLASLDTFTVFSKVEIEEPYTSSGVNYGVLGSMDDPIFGKTVCGFYAQCRLSSDGYSFGNGAVLDSCVLSLVYETKYGSNSQPISIAVYELTESMDAAASYKTNTSFSVNGTPLGVAYNFVPNYTDSVPVLGQNNAPQLRISLNSLGQRILSADSATISGSTNFLNFFKGIYVTPQGVHGNGVSYIALASSKITVFYHNDSNDSLRFEIPITIASARVNHYDHQYTPAIQQQLVSSVVSDSIVYLQSGAGVRVKLTIPSLDSLPQNIAINKAELVISKWNDPSGSDSIYPPPSFISLKKISASGALESLDAAESHKENGGVAISQTKTIDGNTYTQYTFPLHMHIQQIVKRQYPNNGLYLTLAAAASANRVVLANYPNQDKNMKITLRILYTKFQ